MKSIHRAVLATSLLAATAFATAQAQEVAGTLHVDAAPVTVSTDGATYNPVTSDVTLNVGDRINIAAPGKATFTYTNGYVLHYESPGVYTVQLAPAGSTASGTSGLSTVGTAAVVIGAAALAGAAIDSKGNVAPDHPVSN